MCRLCDEGLPQHHFPLPPLPTRRNFLKTASAGVATATAGMSLLAAGDARADDEREPEDSGRRGRRILIRGGAVMSMDPNVGDFSVGDVLIEGKRIVAVGRNLNAGGASVIDAAGRIVMPGFIDTHHHLFETALRSFLADGLLFDGLDARTTQN